MKKLGVSSFRSLPLAPAGATAFPAARPGHRCETYAPPGLGGASHSSFEWVLATTDRGYSGKTPEGERQGAPVP